MHFAVQYWYPHFSRSVRVKVRPQLLNQFTRKGSFTARDAALRLYDVVITQECVHGDNPVYSPEQFLHTAEGEPVIRRRKGQYVLARTGKLLRSSDPCCP